MNRRWMMMLSCAFGLTEAAEAGEPEIFTGLLPGFGAAGYDAVSYFQEGGPKQGSDAFTAEWRGAKWRFANQENLDAFKSDPEKYAPRYGGYCAYAVSLGKTASGDPEAWSVVDDKLFLNYSIRVRQIWREDVPGNIAKANSNWPKVLN